MCRECESSPYENIVASVELAEKYVQKPGVKPSGMLALFASVFSSMFGKARDVRDENRPAPHPSAPSPCGDC